jgi:thiosulfate dehydrogenase [quinone] large subunit
MWIQAGVAKLWGAENPSFLHHNGAGVAGFAGHATPAYSWWGSFLHSFVVPNSGWIAILVAVSELVIGIGLAIGLFTPLWALGSLILGFTYVMSGTASVNGFYALFAVVILAMWRTSGRVGVDGLLVGYRQNHRRRDIASSVDSSPTGAMSPPSVVAPVQHSDGAESQTAPASPVPVAQAASASPVPVAQTAAESPVPVASTNDTGIGSDPEILAPL